MEYSVEDVTKLAKISVRTLHYYDEIGLLKPSVRMENGRRIYSDEQVLRLMDIIFFKKMGFDLEKIGSMLELGNKDKRALMIAKKEFLQKEMKRIKDLIKSIDQTLEFYFKGENKNYDQIIKQFEYFQKSAKEDKQSFLKEFGTLENEESEKLKKMDVQEQMEYFKKRFESVDMKLYGEKMSSCIKKLVEAIDGGLKEDSKEAQDLMRDYYEIMSMIYKMSKKIWLGMGVNIAEEKEAYMNFAKMHPKLPEFLAKAIKIYGENLSE